MVEIEPYLERESGGPMNCSLFLPIENSHMHPTKWEVSTCENRCKWDILDH